MTEDEWRRAPTMPLVGARGHIDQDEVAWEPPAGYYTLAMAVVALWNEIPSDPGQCASIIDADGVVVLSFAHTQAGEVCWRGCQAGFDELARWAPADDVAWAAAVAQNLHLLDVEER